MLNPIIQKKIVSNLAQDWAQVYKKEHNRGPEALNDLLGSPVKALSFFLSNSFARAGGEQAGYGEIASRSLELCLEDIGNYDILIKNPDAPILVWHHFSDLCKKEGIGVNERLNKPVVESLVKASQDSPNYNLFERLASNVPDNMVDSYLVLRGIHGIGDKIAAFNLRDVVSIMGAEAKVKPQDQILLQPIDRWVNGIAAYIWGLDAERTPLWLVALKIISECQKLGASPTSFNQGAWKYGSSIIKDTNRIKQVMDTDQRWQ